MYFDDNEMMCEQCVDLINKEHDVYYVYKGNPFCSLSCVISYLKEHELARLVYAEEGDRCAACGGSLKPSTVVVEYADALARCCDYGCLCDYLDDIGELR